MPCPWDHQQVQKLLRVDSVTKEVFAIMHACMASRFPYPHEFVTLLQHTPVTVLQGNKLDSCVNTVLSYSAALTAWACQHKGPSSDFCLLSGLAAVATAAISFGEDASGGRLDFTMTSHQLHHNFITSPQCESVVCLDQQ